jgi:oligopeptide transport system substrate-binding protein
MTTRWQGVVSALVLLCGACAPSPERPASPGDASTATLRYRMPEDPPTLDPFLAGDDNSLVYIYQLFDGLVEFVPGTLEVRPAVASAWTISPDGLTYTFTLRPGVKFHNGREVTARDVVYSIRRALTPKASGKDGFFEALAGKQEFWAARSTQLEGVAASDDRTVVFKLQHPYEPFLTVLASEAGSILPQEVYDDPGRGWLQRPVGCGPFRLTQRRPDESITLERFADHWKGPARPGEITRLDVRIIRDSSTATEEYRAGHIDFSQEIAPGQRDSIRRDFADHLRSTARHSVFYLGFNHAAPPFAGNATLRRAMAHAIDRDFIVTVLQEGKDLVAAGVITPGMLGFDPARTPPRFDPALASRLLAEAGHPEGRGLPEVAYLSNDTPGFRRIGDRVAADLSRIGVRVKTTWMDLGAFLQALTAPAGQGPAMALYRMNWYADWPDPDNLLGLQFATGAGGNFGRYSNPAFDDLIARGRREPGRAAREAIYRQADTMLIEDAALVPIYWYGQDVLLRPEFEGMKLSPLGTFAIAWEEVRRRP